MGRIAARIFAVVCIGVGVGLLTWGISSEVIHEPVAEQVTFWGRLPSSSAVIGCGAGILAIGIATLLLTPFGPGPDGSWDE
jgi:hypothetical protein